VRSYVEKPTQELATTVVPLMANTSNDRPDSGCLTKTISFLTWIVVTALVVAFFFMFQPQDLGDLKSRTELNAGSKPREMKAVLENAVNRGYPVVISEGEINHWLRRTLVCKQKGLLSDYVSLEGVWVRLEKDVAEVVMERKIMGVSLTTSMYLQIELVSGEAAVGKRIHRHGGPYHKNLYKPFRGGRFGKLVMPQGFLILLAPSYAKLADVFRDEIHLAFTEMNEIKITPRRMILNPDVSMGD